jgi:hypothetical protein
MSNDARDVEVTLDREAKVDEYLHLKLHEDDPGDETFTYSDNESDDQPLEMTKAESSLQRDWIGVQVREKSSTSLAYLRVFEPDLHPPLLPGVSGSMSS